MTSATLDARIHALCSEAARSVAGTPLVEAVDAIVRRLDEPLRVAIAGRVKAGKSTLLNALVGERLAATGAGETTRLVSRYREGIGYSVRAVLRAGGERELRFDRSSGQLDIALDGLAEADIERLDVEWPSSALRELTLIDTPGLASIDGTASIRTREFLGLEDDDSHSEADAVLYLMRHLHPLDAEFLESFQDPSIASASPVNAIAVLSRADEVGAGRLDAMASADRIAARYRTDARVRSM